MKRTKKVIKKYQPSPRYSGVWSKPFWNAVNGIRDQNARLRLWELGVILQDLECRVLRALENSK